MKTGVYKIEHIISGKIYVGSALNIDKRFGEHIRSLRRGEHRNIHLQRAWNKYGETQFVFEIIEFTDSDMLIEREQYHIDNLKVCEVGYNIAPTAGSSLGIKRSAETIERIRLARLNTVLTNEHKINIGKGVRSSQKYLDAMSSTKHKEKQRIANLGINNPQYGKIGIDSARSMPITQYTKEGEFIKDWISLTEAARNLKKTHANISSCCNGRIKSAYGFVWKYKSDSVTDI